jgi:Integrase core domain
MPARKPDWWWDYSWSPVGGCKPVSTGCKNCFAAQIGGTKTWPYANSAGVHDGVTDVKDRRRIFNGTLKRAPPKHQLWDLPLTSSGVENPALGPGKPSLVFTHTPKRLMISLSPMEEALVCELRTRLQLPLDDITEVMRRCVNEKLSRSAIHRCLVRHGLNRRPSPDKPLVGVFETATVGFIHVDLKHLPALEKLKSYAFVAIDRATRYVYLEIHPGRDADTAAGFLNRFLAHFPHRVHTILTDNGSEFTDRFAVDMKNKPHDRPSGRHPFDRVCAKHRIDHRLTKPYRPQTNGLVERFNRRIVEAIGRQPKRGIAHRLFVSHTDRDAFLNRFVHDYNRTRLKCLGYVAPLQALSNLPGPNTCAGVNPGYCG